ncbi:hypothetical protein V8E54_002184 [Elaphomyces granulatus]
MYHLPSNWTAQRSAEQESEMGYLGREPEKQGMPWTAPSPRLKRHPRQAGGEKAPCVHNEPIIGIRLRASVREDNHDIPPCTLEPLSPAERGDFDASIRTLGAMASKLGVGPSKMLATRQAFVHRARIPSSVRDPRVRNAAIGPWIEIPFVNLVTKDGGMELQ